MSRDEVSVEAGVPSDVRSTPDLGELFTALAAAQAEFGEIERTLEARIESRGGSNYRYSYAPLDEVLGVVRPVLARHGLVVMQFPSAHNGTVSVRTRLGHASGQWIENELSVGLARFDPQAVGSAITYVRRYALQAMVGVAPSSSEDCDAADHQTLPKPAQRVSASAPPSESTTTAPLPSQAPRGTIAEIREASGGVAVELSTGFMAGSRNAALIETLRRAQAAGSEVELVCRPPKDARYLPTITDVRVRAS